MLHGWGLIKGLILEVFAFKVLNFNLIGIILLSVLHVAGNVADRDLHTVHVMWVNRVDMKALG